MISIRRASLGALLVASAGLATAASAQNIGLGGDCSGNSPNGISVRADRAVVRAGTPVTVTASGSLDYRYAWRAATGKLFGTGQAVRFDTTGLAPGRYDVVLYDISTRCPVPEGTAVIEVEGCPNLGLVADQTSVTSGEVVTLSATGFEPTANFVWTASEGQIVGSGPTARLETDGLATSSVIVRVSATDPDCQADEQVVVSVVRPEPLPPSFLGFGRNNARLDNVMKAQLDDVAIRAAQDIGASVVIVGSALADERAGVAMRRAQNTRDYLVNEKGLDPSRVDVRTAEASGEASVKVYIVPRGAQLPN